MKVLKAMSKSINSLKYVVLIPLLLIACKKDPYINNEKVDTIETTEKAKDSLSVILKTEKESNQLILSVDASQLPIRLMQEITDPEQQIVLKLENYSHPNLKAYIKSEQPMNIRINQIRMPDNTFDGPFGQTIEYETKQKGEYWLILSKNLMASGNPLGKFFIKIE